VGLFFKTGIKMRFKYPKLALLTLAIIAAYIIFRNPVISQHLSNLNGFGYLAFFIAGILYAFGFSAPFATGFLIVSNPANIWFAGIIAGIGALISDLLIFNFIRISFMDEFKNIKSSKIIKNTGKLIERGLGNKIRLYLLCILAIIVIASPLPDEAGVIMLAGLTRISQKSMALLGFTLNTAGILVILFFI